jgi:hypothetical protein
MAKLAVLLALVLGAYGWWQRGRRLAAMSATEARALLGVDDAADVGAVRAAHRRLIQRVHPDAGGSAELATRVNMARDVLIAELKRR